MQTREAREVLVGAVPWAVNAYDRWLDHLDHDPPTVTFAPPSGLFYDRGVLTVPPPPAP